MPAVDRLDVRFVEFVPETLAEGVLYVSLEYGTVVHLCACGCGTQAVTPLGPKEYRITYDGETVTLRPSVGNWGFECRSHYTVDQGRVTWAGDWTAEEVARNRARDREAKRQLYGPTASTAHDLEAGPTTASFGADALASEVTHYGSKSWVARLRTRIARALSRSD